MSDVEDILNRLWLLFDERQLEQFLDHLEIVARNGFGKAIITYRDGKMDLIIHEVSEKVEDWSSNMERRNV